LDDVSLATGGFAIRRGRPTEELYDVAGNAGRNRHNHQNTWFWPSESILLDLAALVGGTLAMPARAQDVTYSFIVDVTGSPANVRLGCRTITADFCESP